MSEIISLVTNQSEFDQTLRQYSPKILDVDLGDVAAFSYVRNLGHGGLTVNMKDGQSFGIREKLSDILARVADTDESTLKAIKVTVVDRTPRSYGNRQIKIQTTAIQGTMLASSGLHWTI